MQHENGHYFEIHPDGACEINGIVRGQVLCEFDGNGRPVRCWHTGDLSAPAHSGDPRFISMLAEFDTAASPTV